MAKSADAFRTISEVADWLGSPAHVLRFWESKFSQVKPVKRAGGRRYYRPADMALLGGIKKLLHDDGMTIKGVQKILREQGVKHVSSLSQPLDESAAEALREDADITVPAPMVTAAEPEPEPTVVQFQRPSPEPDAAPEPAPEPEVAAEPAAPRHTPPAGPDDATGDTRPADAPSPPGTVSGEPAQDTTVLEDFAAPAAAEPSAPPVDAADAPAASEPDPETAPEPADEAAPEPIEAAETDAETDKDKADAVRPPDELPAFMHRVTPSPSPRAEPGSAAEPERESPAAAPELDPDPEPAILRPARVDVPPDPSESEITAPPGLLATLAKRGGRPLSDDARSELAALHARLADLTNRRSGARKE